MSSLAPDPGVSVAQRPLPELGAAGPVEIAVPPARADDGRAWSALLLPVLSALGMVGFALLSRSVVALAVAGGFAVISAFAAVAASRYQRRRHAREWANKSQAYRRHLATCIESLTEAARRQRSHAEAFHPAPSTASQAAESGVVWERRDSDDGRLLVRLGIGRASARTYARRLGGDPTAAAAPELSRLAEDALARHGGVDGVAMGLDLAQTRQAALLGAQLPLLRALVVSLTRAVGPDSVRVHAMAPPAELAWLRLLPHAGRIASEASAFLAELRSAAREAGSSHDLILLAGKESEVRRAWQALAIAESAAVTVIASLPAESGVPAAADSVISLDGEGGLLVQRLGATPGVTAIALPDALSHAAAMHYARAIGRTFPPRAVVGSRRSSPQLDSLLAHGNRHPLQLPIGVADDGTVVQLDLREAARGGDGPHGLILGATGSGKSELLRTILTAAARQNDPSELTFLLVDFKGGAALSELGRLPHTAGLLTNLTADRHGVDRLCAALRAELRRRQAVLRLAQVDDIDTLIARGGDPAVPDDVLARLLVVVDEYAELIEQSPDVLDVLTSAARVGRSLGVHLLLCSQRLDDGRLRGLEAHLRYRMCLRTFSAAESMSALGSDAASRLPPEPGWGYLSRDGRLVRVRVALTRGGAADLAPLMQPGARTARPVCPPPLPDALSLDQLPPVPATVAARAAAIGVCDRPDLGCRQPLAYDLDTGGHVAVVGAPRSGRSTLLATLVAALTRTFPVRDLAIHVVCPAGGPLGFASGLPHVGTVATTAELAARVIGTVAETVTARRTGAAAAGRHVLLVVDDLGPLAGDDSVIAALHAIATTGLSVGVTLAVSCGRWAELRTGLREAMGTRYELICAEPADSMLPQLARTFPRRPEGRVLTGDGHWAQIALPRVDGVSATSGLAGAQAELVAAVARRGGPPTQPIQLLPSVVPAATLGPASGADSVVLGVAGPYVQPFEVGLSAGEHLLVLGNAGTGRSGLLRAIARGLQGRGMRTWVIDPRRSLSAVTDGAFRRAGGAEEVAELVHDLASCGWVGSGPAERNVLIIDDQELVGGRSGSAVLLPLLDLLPFAADVGLTVVIARRLSGYARGAYEPFFAGFLELCETAVVLSGDPMEGPVIGGVRPRRLPPGRGQLIRRGEPAGEVQVAWLSAAGGDRLAHPDSTPARAPLNRGGM